MNYPFLTLAGLFIVLLAITGCGSNNNPYAVVPSGSSVVVTGSDGVSTSTIQVLTVTYSQSLPAKIEMLVNNERATHSHGDVMELQLGDEQVLLTLDAYRVDFTNSKVRFEAPNNPDITFSLQ